MISTENEAIEIFCRVLAFEIHQITGRAIDGKPDWLVVPADHDPQRNEVQIPPSDRNDLHTA